MTIMMMMMMMMIITDPFTTNLVVKGPVAKGSVVKGATSMMTVMVMMMMAGQLDRRIGELSLLYMDMVVCEALKYSMMIQLDSCRYHSEQNLNTLITFGLFLCECG